MVDEHEMEFETADAGASETVPIQCSALREGSPIVINGHPCTVKKGGKGLSTAKTGKHGHAKVSIDAVDIFTGATHQAQHPSTHNVDQPVIKKSIWQLIDIDGDFLNLINAAGDTQKDDIKLPAGKFGEEIKSDKEKLENDSSDQVVWVTVLSALGQEHAVKHDISKGPS
ncbi:MAG: Eukaryotic translation initiation factor 5A [Chrysothrix sp. TS-e1954]|nr:MAG: Eukaryotic translation initiation factor 5A [Chrysothrix sp. TS-e1954]